MPEPEEFVHFGDVFGKAGEWVLCDVTGPTHTAELSDATGLPTLLVGELTAGAQRTWQMGGGWPAFMTRLSAVAELLGGKAEYSTSRAFYAGAETHFCIYKGEAVEC
jgi:hypothetical protein